MKYIVYYSLYLMGEISANISTIILIKDDTVMFYIYDVGYITWNIESKDQIIDDNTCIIGVYHLKYKDMKAIMTINCQGAVIMIFVEGKAEQIILKKPK